ncbi:hypothetical protein WAI453_003371 [Rhynchosporium graminicola]
MKLITLSYTLSLIWLAAADPQQGGWCTAGVAGTGECEGFPLYGHTYCCSDKKSSVYFAPRTCTGGAANPKGAPLCPGGGQRACCP